MANLVAGTDAARADDAHHIAKHFDVGLFVMSGMAAGVRGKVQLGDVVAAETVIDYEGARLEGKVSLKRPETYNVLPERRRELNYFLANKASWWDGLESKLAMIGEEHGTPGSIEPGWQPNDVAEGRSMLAMDINAWLAEGMVQPMFAWGEIGTSVALGSRCLFGALGLQLLVTIAGSQGMALCSACGHWYSPSRQPRPGQRSFCVTCRQNRAPGRCASRDYRKRRAKPTERNAVRGED